jgi:hypothetical protein
LPQSIDVSPVSDVAPVSSAEVRSASEGGGVKV